MNQIDKEIFDLKEEKKTLVALERLLINPDFKRVIEDDFLSKHPLDLIMSKGRLSLDPEHEKDIDRQLECVALFKMYLQDKASRIADIDLKISEAETLRDQQTQG